MSVYGLDEEGSIGAGWPLPLTRPWRASRKRVGVFGAGAPEHPRPNEGLLCPPWRAVQKRIGVVGVIGAKANAVQVNINNKTYEIMT